MEVFVCLCLFQGVCVYSRCVYVCVYVCMCVCVCVSMYVCVCTYIWLCMIYTCGSFVPSPTPSLATVVTHELGCVVAR